MAVVTAPWTGSYWSAGIPATGYEASRIGRRLRGWVAPRLSINQLLSGSGDLLLARARQMCRENAYASNACDAFVAAAVGSGIKPSSLVQDSALKEQIQKAWLRWTDESDADGLTDFYGQQALAARAMFEAGECFIRFRPRLPQDGLSVPLQIQLLEAEHLPFADNRDLANGNRVRSGIEFNAIGKRVSYHFLRQHPGELGGLAPSTDVTVVPASEVMHLYRPLRPGQIRGQPGITPAMIRLYLLDQYDDAELDRKKTAAMFAGFVTKAAPEDLGPVPTEGQEYQTLQGQVDIGSIDLAGLEPGTLQVLAPGEDVKFSDPAEVGGSYEAFQYRTLLAIAAAVGLPYHAVTADVSKANYSSLRASQVDSRRRMDQFQWATLIFQLCRPVWQRWFQTALLSGAITPPPDFLKDPYELASVKWITPHVEWVDPMKDREAEKLAVDNGWKSRSDVIEAEGFDPEEVDRRIVQDREREKSMGLSFPVASAPAAPAAAPAEKTDDEQPIEPAGAGADDQQEQSNGRNPD